MTYLDSALIQFAGEFGFLSAGLEREFSRYTIGGLYGLVPREISGGKTIETVVLRQTYRFYDWNRVGFYAGLNLYHVLGLNYRTSKFRDAPQGYYPIGSIRGLLNLGVNINMRNENRSFYFETGINDIWITNVLTNAQEINPRDHLSMGMGYKFNF